MLGKKNRYPSRKIKIRDRHPLDDLITKTCHCGMEDGLVMKIEYKSGFEDWGTYESWGQGYVVTGRDVTFSSKYLDDAIKGWAETVKIKESKDKQ